MTLGQRQKIVKVGIVFTTALIPIGYAGLTFL
jgi:hypothetical protein